jgi:spore germination protein GerM
VRGDRPEAVLRQVPRPGSVRQVLEQLFSGPTEQESAAGLATAIPTAFELEDVSIEGRIAVVTIAGLGDQVRTDNNVAYAQIVATLDARPDVDGVRFRTDDGDLPVPRGDGSLTDSPVSRGSYAELLTPAAPAPPAAIAPAPAPSG